MNTVQNGKGDRPRNNWGLKWYSGYEAINWHKEKDEQAPTPSLKQDAPAGSPQDQARDSEQV